METVGHYCKEAHRFSKQEGPVAQRAVRARTKIPSALRSIHDSKKQEEALELVWRSAYYPYARSSTETAKLLCPIFCGELSEIATEFPHLAGKCFLYCGDLHRYLSSAGWITVLHYKKAFDGNPDWGQPLNQLGLLADPPGNIRLFFNALLAKQRTNFALENLHVALRKEQKSGLSKLSASILSSIVSNSSHHSLPRECKEFLTELRVSELNFEALLLLHNLTLGSLLDDQTIRELILMLSDCWQFFLNKVQAASADFLLAARQVVSLLEEQKRVVPRALKESLEKLGSALCDNANLIIEPLETACEEEDLDDSSLQTRLRWDDKVALKTAAHFLYDCVDAPEIPISFSTMFTINAGGPRQLSLEDLGKRMAKLKANLGDIEDRSWLPVYGVPDLSVFEGKCATLRQIMSQEMPNIVIPYSILSYIDRNKHKGYNYRNALRLILNGQRNSSLRVIGTDAPRGVTVDEEYLREEVVQTAMSLVPKNCDDSGNLITILTTNIDAYPQIKSEGDPIPCATSSSAPSSSCQKRLSPAVSIHEIEAFRERWNKELSWRSAV
ncbi:unnamed protein product, partial [Mesorhabditis spiculigera]